MNRLDEKTKMKAYLIFLLASCFYLYEFILQVAPSVMAEPMMKTFGVTAEGFGIISAFYFYAYAPMQLPAGLMFDRYGPRRLMTFALILCALGSFFFASTESVITAALGRFMIGIGSAFSFIGVLVLCSRWFPAHHFAILAGVAQLMSSVGAIFGEMPLAWLIHAVGWRQASFILALLGILLSGLLWRIVRDYPDGHEEFHTGPGLKVEMNRLFSVCGKSYTWLIGGYAFSIWTPIAVFAALWGVPYLQEKFHISVVAASGMCSIIWVGIGLGSPLLGWLSDRLNNRKIALGLSSVMGLIATLFILFDNNMSFGFANFMLFIFGLGAGGQSVSFAVVRDYNPPQLVGTASGFNNLSVLIGGSIFQPLVGILLHHSNAWHIVNDVPVYSVLAYQKALIIMPICYLASLLIVVFGLKESHPNSKSVILNEGKYLEV
jgi:MFS family permease